MGINLDNRRKEKKYEEKALTFANICSIIKFQRRQRFEKQSSLRIENTRDDLLSQRSSQPCNGSKLNTNFAYLWEKETIV
jgi:hypothetical protein